MERGGILGIDSPVKLGFDANAGMGYMHSYSPILILLHPTLIGDEIRNHCTFIAKGTNVDPFTRANSQSAIHPTASSSRAILIPFRVPQQICMHLL